ncbi:hypothetical protein A2U01_0099033, partial [Trifolium medium]|nr:hypothetical protein [Trifolium medium]
MRCTGRSTSIRKSSQNPQRKEWKEFGNGGIDILRAKPYENKGNGSGKRKQ